MGFSRAYGLEQDFPGTPPARTYSPVVPEATGLSLSVSTCVRGVAAGHILGDETDILRGISPCFRLPGKSSTLTLLICRLPNPDYSSAEQLFLVTVGRTKRWRLCSRALTASCLLSSVPTLTVDLRCRLRGPCHRIWGKWPSQWAQLSLGYKVNLIRNMP